MHLKTLALPALALITLALSFAQAPSSAQAPRSEAPASRVAPVRVYVVRHADRAGKADALSPEGRVRALALAQIALRQGVSAIYSTDTARTKATVRPSADAIGAEIRTYPPMPQAAWFAELAERHAGSAILIVGHSNTVLPIVRGFGGRSDATIEHDTYHQIFALDAVFGNFSRTQVVELAFGARDATELRADKSRPTSQPARAGSGR